MNGNINFLFQERVFDLLGENPFATYRLDGSLDEAIAAGFDDDSGGHIFQGLFLCFGQVPQTAAEGFFHFLPANLFESLFQCCNRWDLLQRTDPTGKVLDLLENDAFRPFRLSGPFLKVLFGDIFQIVDIIDVDVVELVYFGIEISPVADVNEEHRLLLPFFEHLLDHANVDQNLGRAGAADHQIGHFKIVRKILVQDGTAVNPPGQFYGPFESAIGDH